MAKWLAVSVLLALIPTAMASPTNEAGRLIGAPVFLDGDIRYGVIERVLKDRNGNVSRLLVRPDAPSSGVYALDWAQVRLDPHTGSIIIPDYAAQLAIAPLE